MSDNTATPLKILCLHGRQQTGNIFEKRLETTIRRLRTQSKLELEWHFLDAPFPCTADPRSEGQKTWWHDSSNPTTYPHDKDTSLKLLQATLTAQSFHFILAFSQGCALVAEAALAGLFDSATTLQCLVFAGGLLPTLCSVPTTPSSLLPNIPTLHFAGLKDGAVPIATSQQLAQVFVQSTFVVHQQGHCFPSRASESQTLIAFLEKNCAAPACLPSEDLMDELEALACIYTKEEFCVVNEQTKQLSVKVHHTTRTIELMFRFLPGYPADSSLQLTTGDLIHCTKQTVQGALRMANASIAENQGIPQVFAVVQAVQDYLDEEEEQVEIGTDTDTDRPPPAGGEVDKQGTPTTAASRGSDPEEKEKHPVLNAINGAISSAALSTLTEEAAIRLKRRHDDTDFPPRRRKSMYWGNFTIGLVGKPSAGKSTFFNACKTLGTNAARVGGFPFTTIEPNLGRCAVRFVWPKVIQTEEVEEVEGAEEAEDAKEEGLPRLPRLHRSFEMEVFIKDVAGLVQGAYQGRGRGNKFLDDLCGADVLIHVLDGSGDTDAEGNSSSGLGNPAEEVEWVYAEIHRWISDNVLSKWHMVVRKNTREAIASLFTGYRNVKEDVDRSAQLAGLLIEDNKAKVDRKDFVDWTKEEVHRLVGFFLRLRFPILIGFNKCDDERSKAHLVNVNTKYIHEVVVPMSAMVENVLLARLEEVEESRGGGGGKVEEGGEGQSTKSVTHKNQHNQQHQQLQEDTMISNCFRLLNGETGVRECIDRAVSLQRPTVVYVIRIPLTSSSNITLTPEDVVPLLFRRGVTPHDVYKYLLHTENPDIRVTGDFVRSEYVSTALDGSLGTRLVIKKNIPIDAHAQCVLRIYTAKTSAWQKNGSGGGGGGDTAPKKKSAQQAKGGGGGGGESGGGGRAEKKLRSRDKLIKKLHKSADRQGKSKGGKGTGQDRRCGNIG